MRALKTYMGGAIGILKTSNNTRYAGMLEGWLRDYEAGAPRRPMLSLLSERANTLDGAAEVTKDENLAKASALVYRALADLCEDRAEEIGE